MDITFIYKIGAVGLIVAILNQLLSKSGKEEYTLLTTIAGIILSVLMLLPEISKLNEEISTFFGL